MLLDGGCIVRGDLHVRLLCQYGSLDGKKSSHWWGVSSYIIVLRDPRLGTQVLP